MKCNNRADNGGVECNAFRRFGCGTCPETPRSDGVCGVPKRPTFALIFLTSSGGGVS